MVLNHFSRVAVLASLWLVIALPAAAERLEVLQTVGRRTVNVDCDFCMKKRCFKKTILRKRKFECDKIWDCNSLDCKNLRCKRCTCGGCFEDELTEKQEFRCERYGCSGLFDCPRVCVKKKQAPTDIGKPKEDGPKPNGTPRKRAGTKCRNDGECKSRTCRDGVCMASRACYPLKHDFGVPFDKNKINIVFVGSGFDSAGRSEWQRHVNSTYGAFTNPRFKMFSVKNPQFNVFYTMPRRLDESFCYYGCQGVDRLLCCDISKARALANKCFPTTEYLQTVVIHNDEKYGGAGYTLSNLATTSLHPSGPLVAVHELGHSLFELADEYSSGNGAPHSPNCDNTGECTKWRDLIKDRPRGYDPVSCVPGCAGSQFFMPEFSFMGQLDLPVGAVNERFTCCTYLALSKSMPSYCRVFDISPNYLFNYCKENDYQGYGKANYAEGPIGINAPPLGTDVEGTNYIFLERPLIASVALHKGKMGAIILKEPVYGEPGLYRKCKVLGDFSSRLQAENAGIESIVRIKIHYVGNSHDTLFFAANSTVEVPPSVVSNDDNEGFPPPPIGPLTISEKTDVLDLALDTKGREVDRVVVQLERL